MAYSEKLMDHYEHPRNVGTLDVKDDNVGTGMVGAPACGDVMRLQIKVNDEGVIEDAKFKTYGCGSAIASSSLVTEWVKGKTLDEAGQLTEKVRRKPYAVVLFDEIEKAHEDVFNLLLQVMEDGQLTDSLGRKVNFRNAVVVMTSNVGAKAITDSRRSLGFAQQTGADAGRTDAEIRSMVMSDLKKTFRPEFLNRVDEIIVFHKLTRADTRRIAQKLLGTVNRRMERAGVELRVPDAALDALSATGYDPVYGARPLRRAIQSTIADQAAGMLLDGSLRRGDVVTAQVREGKIVLTKTCERGMITP